MPTGLDAECRAEWKRLRAELEPMGIVTLADGSPLERIVWLRVQCRLVRKLLEQFKEAGFAYRCGTAWQQMAQVGVLNNWHKELGRLESEFGIGAASRTRVEVTDPGKAGGPKLAVRTKAG